MVYNSNFFFFTKLNTRHFRYLIILGIDGSKKIKMFLPKIEKSFLKALAPPIPSCTKIPKTNLQISLLCLSLDRSTKSHQKSGTSRNGSVITRIRCYPVTNRQIDRQTNYLKNCGVKTWTPKFA